MHRLRRREARRRYYRAGKIKLAAGARACATTVVDISDGGVRLNVEGLDVPDEFVLLISNDRKVQEKAYKVVWRFGKISLAPSSLVAPGNQALPSEILLKHDPFRIRTPCTEPF